MTIAILVVLKRRIVVPTTGEPAYIEQDTDVVRFRGGEDIESCFAAVEAGYPKALSFEIYRPRTDAAKVKRY